MWKNTQNVDMIMWRSEMDQANIQIHLENFVGILCQVSAQSTLLFRQIIFHQKYPDKLLHS